MKKELYRVSIERLASQRGTGKPIQREQAIVYDFMPVTLGEQFRTNSILSKMLLRSPPVGAPFMLTTTAYETLGFKYFEEGEIIPALECYRIALDSRTSFVTFIAKIQKNVLLNQNELSHLELFTPLEEMLLKESYKSKFQPNPELYAKWIKELRTARKNWFELNHNDYGSEEYVKACLKVGEYEEAIHHARKLNKKELLEEVESAMPREILDVEFLRKYVDDNHPESSLF